MIEVVIIFDNNNEKGAKNLVHAVLDGIYEEIQYVSFERVDKEG